MNELYSAPEKAVEKVKEPKPRSEYSTQHSYWTCDYKTQLHLAAVASFSLIAIFMGAFIPDHEGG